MYMDKNRIRGDMQRVILDGEYEELMEYVRPTSYCDLLRLKDLGKEN